jgi:SAM-dependent methyltransferase
MNGTSFRQAHVVMDLESRQYKGEKIARLLDLVSRPAVQHLLEVGTGSGGIAHYFGAYSSLCYTVDAIDLNDHRVIMEGYRILRADGTRFPFRDQAFAIALSNQVIEHVGDCAAQREQLRELRRVLKPGGCGYLAVPNRWMVIEPHYKLPFLSWLPSAWRTTCLRLCSKGRVYDREARQMRQSETIMRQTGMDICNMGVQALRATLGIEHPGSWMDAFVRRMPDAMLMPFNRVIPNLIYRFARSNP